MGERHTHAPLARALAAAGVVAALAAAMGCGSDGERSDEQRPPAPIVITASISNEAVSVSPRRFGSGPINLLVTNQTGTAQRVTLESDDAPGEGPGIRQETAPINPRDTARLSADVQPGRYRVHVGEDGIQAGRLVVGDRRPSAQDALDLP
jgi:hypothetical protein